MSTIEERKAEYATHKVAGEDYYNTIRAQLTIDVENGTKQLNDVLVVEQMLVKVSENLIRGDWKTALFNIKQVLSNVHLPQSDIDTIKGDIENYITQNYSW